MKKPTIDLHDEFIQAILTCAMRYSGRETYMPGMVTDWIMAHMNGKLLGNTLDVIKRDIDEVPEDRRWTDYDRKTWERLREWLERQEANK